MASGGRHERRARIARRRRQEWSTVTSRKPKPTPIETAYRDLGKTRSIDAHDLASSFVASIEQLERQLRGDGPFYPGKRKPLPNPAEIRQGGRIAGTDDLAALLWEPTRFKVDRRPKLDFHYVDRELVAARSLSSSGKPQITGTKLWLDLLLANANSADRTPIVGEAKLRHDKDPEAALVQGLAYAAQLGTKRQLARLASLYPDYFIDKAKPATPTRLDVYVITYKMPRSREPKLRKALELAEGVVADPAVSRHLRRIAFLDADLRNGRLRFRCRARPAESVER